MLSFSFTAARAVAVSKQNGFQFFLFDHMLSLYGWNIIQKKLTELHKNLLYIKSQWYWLECVILCIGGCLCLFHAQKEQLTPNVLTQEFLSFCSTLLKLRSWSISLNSNLSSLLAGIDWFYRFSKSLCWLWNFFFVATGSFQQWPLWRKAIFQNNVLLLDSA